MNDENYMNNENHIDDKEQQIIEKELEAEEKYKGLEELITENGILSYNAQCVRKKSNWSKPSSIYKFDDESFEPQTFLKNMPHYSPKLHTLMKNIEELDKKDMREHGKLFKHFIFSDLKSSSYGAKLIASAFIAKGFHLGYHAHSKKNDIHPIDMNSSPENIAKIHPYESPISKDKENIVDENIVGGENGEEDDDNYEYDGKKNDGKGIENNDGKNKKPIKKRYHKIELVEDQVLQSTKQNNFYILSSVGVYDQPINVHTKKNMLSKFNQRPENIHGDLIRFIILDSGFKEGIDLFDIKYIHIFEPSTVPSDQKQVIGRGTRTCGQKGLEFHPTHGWVLHIFVYDLEIQDKLRNGFMGAKSTMDLYLKSLDLDIRLLNFAHDLERSTIVGSVDYDLNKNVHSFSIPLVSVTEQNHRAIINEHLPKNTEALYGGEPNFIIRPGSPIIVNRKLNYLEMKQFIIDKYKQFSWEISKMENHCIDDKQKGGSGQIIKYNPTQNFISHYFHPLNPVKGMIVYHSTGTGKSCCAIATATRNFEPNGYTILWVTRTTLKSDIWKNMFHQVCNESIRNQIQNSGLKIPEDNKKRMGLLSKAWRIHPMSYKQFSNLILRQNSFYDALVKINGREDPLRKTLLIIDEAHKLYGGDDLSSIERPDMNVLQQALSYSYQYSGQDSVRLLLMTATPITKNPMELIQLINLCKPTEEKMPSDFSNFSEKYLNENGEFTQEGRATYLDDIAGYISYLNREKDARQFAQPQIHHMKVPIISDTNIVEKFDKKLVKELLDTDVSDLKQELEQENQKLENELGNISASKFAFLKDEFCGDLSGKPKTMCTKILNSNIRDMVLETKNELKDTREKIKDIRERIKGRQRMRKTALFEVKQNIEKYPQQYEEYKNSLFYELKDKCAIKVGNKTNLEENIHKHPVIHKYDLLIQKYNSEISDLHNQYKQHVDNYKKRMQHLKNMLAQTKNNLERNVIHKTIRDERNEFNNITQIKKKEMNESEKVLKSEIQQTEKKRAKRFQRVKKTIKNMMTNEKQRIRDFKQEKKMLRKTLRSQQTEIKHHFLKELVNKYRSKILEDMVDADQEEYNKELDKKDFQQNKQTRKIHTQQIREQMKQEKMKERGQIREQKLSLKQQLKQKKEEEKQQNRQTRKLHQEQKLLLKQQLKQEKEQEKEEKKQQKLLLKEQMKQQKEQNKKTRKLEK
jgi:hypothetical protein